MTFLLRSRPWLPVLALCSVLAVASAATAVSYPETRRGNQVDDYFGNPVADPYRWLEDLDSAETRAWISAQNALALPLLAGLPEREAFDQRLAELWNVERLSVPESAAGRLFFTRGDGLRNQPLLYVREADAAEPRLLLDPNLLSEDGTVALTSFEPSPDGRWLAYSLAASGSDWNQIRILDVATGVALPETLTRVKFSQSSWTKDSQGFLYSRYPDAPSSVQGVNRTVFDDLAHQKVYFHRLNSPQSEDVLIFERPDQPKWFVGAEVSSDGKYLFLYMFEGSADENQLAVVALGDPKAPALNAAPRPLVTRFDASHSVIGTVDGVAYVLTNHAAARRQIVAMDLARPAPENWKTVVPESADTLQSATLAGGQLIVHRMRDAASRLDRYSLDGKPLGSLPLPGLGAVTQLSGDWSDPKLYFGYTSFNQPQTTFAVDLGTDPAIPLAYLPPRLAFDPADFVTEQVFYPSLDGTRVPMFLTYKKGLEKNGAAQVFLHAYGGFNIPKVPAFDPSSLAWMERGGVYAVASLRGGGEYGRDWHLAGTRERKQNVFDDFYAAGQYLVREGWTQPRQIAIWGRSNGGLLVGASVNQRPEFWGAAVATVGVMDMLRFHTFTVGYAWTGDYGSSETREGFEYLRAYSPLHTVKPGTAYPPTLITTGDHDDRVHPAHSYKYAAALQHAQTGDAPLLIRVDTDAGHGAGKPVSKLVAEEADKLGFLWHYTKARPAG